jgi:Flp pilus assembly protein TadG
MAAAAPTPTPCRLRTALLDEEGGQVLVLLAVMLTILLGFAGLAADVGTWYRAQRQAQTVVDAAALAAAQALPGDTEAATRQALNYAQRNGTSIPAGDVSFGSGAKPNDTVTVDLREREQTFFAKLFGLDSVTVHVTSTARASDLAQALYAAPFGIVNTQPELAGPGCPCFHVPTTLDLSRVGPGGFKIMNIDGAQGGNGGPGTLAGWIQNGYNGTMGVGWYYSMPGAKFNSSLVKNALDRRLNTDLLFPVYDSVQGNGANLQYHVIGWAAFNMQSYAVQGNSGTIDGWFDHVTWTGVAGGNGTPDYGVITVGLIN